MTRKNHFQPRFEGLETRELMTTGLTDLSLLAVQPEPEITTVVDHAIDTNVVDHNGFFAALVLNDPVPADRLPLPTDDHPIEGVPTLSGMVPVLSSNPSAIAKLYLNFGGDVRDWWHFNEFGKRDDYPNALSKPYDTDGDPLTISDREVEQITEIWARVAEDFSIFNIDVTTVDPGNLDNGKTLMVNIGESNNWYNKNKAEEDLAGGISSIGSFTDDAPNVVYAFAEYLGGTTAVKTLAEAASHEAGHSFGLLHHHIYHQDGSYDELSRGEGNWTPIMGGPTNLGTRYTWSIGTVDWNEKENRPIYQNDILTVGSAKNGFGFRDGIGDTIDTAKSLTLQPLNDRAIGEPVGATVLGAISYHPKTRQVDVDVYSFTIEAKSRVTVGVDTLGYENGANLKVRLELWTDKFEFASTAYGQDFALLSTDLDPGTYFVKVRAGGSIEDLGQYTLTVRASTGTVIAKAEDRPNPGRLVINLAPGMFEEGLVVEEAVGGGFAEDAPDVQALAAQLREELGLHNDGNLWVNWGGKDEKWVQGSQGEWYFILPTGEFYRWDGSGQATGELVAVLDLSFHQDVSKLINALDLKALAVQLDTELGLYSDGNLYENWGGKGEKWVQGSQGEWYFILPSGEFYRWDGSGLATGELVASLDASFYQDVNKLINAKELVGTADLKALAVQLDTELGLHSDGNLYENWGGKGEKWVQGSQGEWYFILPNGEFYRWDGSNQATGELVARLDPSYHQDVSKLFDAADPVPVANLGSQVVDFALARLNQQVGGGECAHLVEAALQAAGAKTTFDFGVVGEDADYVWGTLIVTYEVGDALSALANVQAGDIIQYRNVTITADGGSFSYPHHTSIVQANLGAGKFTILEQHVNKEKWVHQNALDLSGMTGGVLWIYRPVAL